MDGYRWGCLVLPITPTDFYELPKLNPVDSSRVLVVVCATNDRIGKLKSSYSGGDNLNRIQVKQ